MRGFLFRAGVVASMLVTAVAADADEVGQRTLSFYDEKRQRPVVTEVWYPTADALRPEDREVQGPYVRSPTVRNGRPPGTPYPLILLSHGTGGGRLTMEWLAAGLARRGHVVAAVDHWGNTHDNAIPEFFLKSWERPQDLSLALTELLRHPELGPAIASESVGAIGFSLGGYTVLALAGGEMDLEALYRFSATPEGRREADIPELPQLARLSHDPATKAQLFADHRQAPPLRDPRIRAVVALAPALGQAFTAPSQFSSKPPPILIVGAEADHLAPVATNAAHYHRLIPTSRLSVLRGRVGHYVFLNEAHPYLQDQLPGLFIDDPSVDRHDIHQDMIRLAAEFLAEHLASPDRTGGP